MRREIKLKFDHDANVEQFMSYKTAIHGLHQAPHFLESRIDETREENFESNNLLVDGRSGFLINSSQQRDRADNSHENTSYRSFLNVNQCSQFGKFGNTDVSSSIQLRSTRRP
jgi:hypothetical protein